MSESKFTPWIAKRLVRPIEVTRVFVILFDAGNGTQLRVDSRGEFEEADAHLIAAAPDMYEAILSVLHADACGFAGMMDSALSKARAAIAKAEGKPE